MGIVLSYLMQWLTYSIYIYNTNSFLVTILLTIWYNLLISKGLPYLFNAIVIKTDVNDLLMMGKSIDILIECCTFDISNSK